MRYFALYVLQTVYFVVLTFEFMDHVKFFYYYYLMWAFSLYFHKYLARFRQNISFWRLDDKTFKCPALYLWVTDFLSEYAMIGPFICDLVTALLQGNYFWFSFQFEWWKSVT